MAELAVAVSLLSALVQFGMLVIHCRRDKKQFEELARRADFREEAEKRAPSESA